MIFTFVTPFNTRTCFGDVSMFYINNTCCLTYLFYMRPRLIVMLYADNTNHTEL